MGFFSGLLSPPYSQLVIDKWRFKMGKAEGPRKRIHDGRLERETRELQFHRIPEDEGATVLETFHGKPNIRGMLRRCTPEFPA